MSRHPYTHAADFIRALGPIGPSGVVLSRGDASGIRRGIAEVIGMDDHELAVKLSEAQQAKTETDHQKEHERFMRELAWARQERDDA